MNKVKKHGYKVNVPFFEKKYATGMPYWRIADELGISEITLIRKLRHQLQPDQEAEVLEAIRKAELKVKAERSEVERE